MEAQLTGTSSSFGGDGIAKIYPYVTLHGKSSADRAPITWRNGTEYTFSGSAVYDASDLSRAEYVLPYASFRLSIVADGGSFGGGNSNYTAWPPTDFASGGCMKVLSKRDNPVLVFDAERFPDDEAERVKANIRLTGDALPAELDAHGYTATLYKRPETAEPGTDEEIELNCFIGDIIAGLVDDMTAIGDEFPNTSGWILTMYVSNGYESTSATVSVPRAFANMHLSGKTTGGVAFGGFSKSEEGNPMAEFHYPIHAYGKIHAHAGVEGIGITYPNPNDPYTDPSTGEEQFTGDYWVDGRPIYRRTAEGYIGATSKDIDFQTLPKISTLISLYGCCKTSGTIFPINHYWGGSWFAVAYIAQNPDTSHIIANCSHKNDIFVVIEFTKESDPATIT